MDKLTDHNEGLAWTVYCKKLQSLPYNKILLEMFINGCNLEQFSWKMIDFIQKLSAL